MGAGAPARPMLKFVTGDLLSAGERYIAQGVAEGNQEGLGTGLALKISSKWPDAQSRFKRHCRSGKFTGGSLFVVLPTASSPGIIYLATQPNMYHATLPYLRKSLRRLAAWADQNEVESVAMPKIAAGLGKLSWISEVKPLLSLYLADAQTSFVVYETFTREMEA